MTTRQRPSIAFATSSHDHDAVHRDDAEWLADALRHPGATVVVVHGGDIPVVEGRLVLLPGRAVGDAGEGVLAYLGDQQGRPCFALLAHDGGSPGPEWTPLRDHLAQLPADEAGLAVHAVSLAQWHRSMRFCPHCGARLEVAAAGHQLHCRSCGRTQFPRTDAAVIMLVTDGDRALLGRQPSWPPGRYSTLAGFVEPGESLEDAVRREVAEEVGVRIGRVDYVGSQPWPFPASLMVGFEAHAETLDIALNDGELDAARWFTREELREGAGSGELGLPPGASISRALIEGWYGAALPGSW